jgi:hypothetical protein
MCPHEERRHADHASLIRIHLRHTLEAGVTDLIGGWGQCDNNRRRAKGHTSHISK